MSLQCSISFAVHLLNLAFGFLGFAFELALSLHTLYLSLFSCYVSAEGVGLCGNRHGVGADVALIHMLVDDLVGSEEGGVVGRQLVNQLGGGFPQPGGIGVVAAHGLGFHRNLEI